MKLKKTIVARDIDNFTINKKISESHIMKAGDLAVFEVIEIGKHTTAQMSDGKVRSIFPGDKIVATFADRYATSQFEGYVPSTPLPIYHILGAGGVIGIVKSKNYALKDVEPTAVKLIGYCCDSNGEVINTKFYNKQRNAFRGEHNMKVILSIGSTMDSGKTTTAAFVARGLSMADYKVGFVKLTGTCFTKDREFVLDCGASIVADFSDLGFPSTFMCSKEDILDIYQTLLDDLSSENLDYLVMEIADGLLQRETHFLLNDQAFMNTIHKVVFSCGDSLSAYYGVQLLKEWGIDVSAVSGIFTMSPLLINEVEANLKVSVFTIDEIMTGNRNNLFGANTPQTRAKEVTHSAVLSE
jgi:hypothetical protein